MHEYYQSLYRDKWIKWIKKHKNRVCMTAISFNHNLTFNIIQKNPELKWNWNSISYNRKIITIDILKSHSHINWDYEQISIYLPWEDIENNPNLFHNYDYISRNHNITPNIIERYLKNNKDIWNWEYLSDNPNLNEDFITKYIYKPWDFLKISNRSDLSFEFFVKYKYMFQCTFDSYDKYYFNLSRNSMITPDIIEANPDFNWDWFALSFNNNLTIDFVKKNLDKNLDWNVISVCNNIKWKEIEENKDLYWIYDMISSTNKVNIEIVKRNRDIYFNPGFLSYNPTLKYTDINENLDIEWNWNIISKNKNIDIFKLKELNNDFSKNISWKNISYNYYLTPSLVETYLDKNLNWSDISGNSFEYDKQQFIKSHIKTLIFKYLKKNLCDDVLNIILDFTI